jgi:uncharacterized delta-60 repeat protein
MWFRTPRKRKATAEAIRRRQSYRPRLESLEDRCLLSGGALDPTFGTGGIVTTAVGSNSSGAHAVVVQSDGKIVAGGNGVDATGNPDFTLARYNANGTLDGGFGTNGIVQTVVGKNGSYISGLALQSDGKIVAVGHASSNATTAAFAVVRYNSNGSLDTTFGGGGHHTGIVLVNAGSASNVNGANAVAIDGNGKIDVAGTSTPGSLLDFTLMRFNSNGTLDTTFGPSKNGIVTTQVSSQANQAHALVIQADGMIVVAGTSHNSNEAGIGVVRYTATGQLDASFGAGGIIANLLPPGTTGSEALSVLILSSGLIVTSGDSTFATATGNKNELTLARFTSSGQVDSTFGSAGFAYDGAMGVGATIALGTNGDLLAAGWFESSTNDAFQVGAFLQGGTLDTAFGNNGTTTTDFPSGITNAPAMAIQGDGKIVVAGWTSPATGAYPEFTLVRYLPSGPQIGSFTASPNPVTSGSSLTLTASNITDANPSSSITQVTFYYFDSSGNKVTLGTATTSSGGAWSVTFTVNLSAGSYTIYAQAEDNYGVFSSPDPLTLTVQ